VCEAFKDGCVPDAPVIASLDSGESIAFARGASMLDEWLRAGAIVHLELSDPVLNAPRVRRLLGIGHT